jgi:hypothetical protein
MEYFIGSITTIILLSVLLFFTRRIPAQESISIQTSQSYLFELIGRDIMVHDINKSKPTQSSKYLERIFIKIIIVKNKAYWIKDNVFYVADMIDNDVDKSTAKEVDIMSMNKVQLEEAMFIIDKLKEDSYNDSWDSGQ